MPRIWLVFLVIVCAFAMQALAEKASPNADEARRQTVVATVGSETITVGELEDAINVRSPYARKRFAEPSVLREFVDDTVRNELYYQGAEKLGYGEDPEVSRFVDQTLIQLFVRKEFQEPVTPDDIPKQEVATYYQEHSDEFRRPEMRRARHILVASKEEAKAIRNQLLSDKGAKFPALAKQKSLDTETKLRGGDLLYFTKDGTLIGREDAAGIDPTLAKAAFKLDEPGDLSVPLDLGDGKWSILELTGIRPERVQTLQQASSAIRRDLWRKEREAALDKLVTDLRAELKPEVYPERMDAIVLEASDQPIESPHQ